MHKIEVAAAVLIHDHRVLAARRPAGKHLAGLWEFPGGKLEAGETPGECLIREIREELGIEISVTGPFLSVRHDYPTFRIHLHTFACTWESGTLQAWEHQELRWLDSDSLQDVQWAPADHPVVEKVHRILSIDRRARPRETRPPPSPRAIHSRVDHFYPEPR